MDDYALDTNDIAPILGQLQLRVVALTKTVEQLRARIAELEKDTQNVPTTHEPHSFEAERREINGLVRN